MPPEDRRCWRFLAAILAIFVAYVRAAVKVAGAPQDYSGPMAKPHRMFLVTVTALLCALRADVHPTRMARPELGPARDCSRADRSRLRIHGHAAGCCRGPLLESENGINAATWQRLFGFRQAFDEPIVVLISAVLAFLLVLSPLVILGLDRAGRLPPILKADLWQRYGSWLVMIPMILVPILMGAFWTIVAVGLLSLFCFREFSRATGFFREKLMSLLVILGINGLDLRSLDKWYHLFVALTPIVIVVIAAVSTSLDQPHGYIQRMALASLSFLLFGTCLGHLGYLANSSYYRSLLLLLIFSVQMNDVFAYVVGKSIGGPKLAPRTSPNKTISGSLARSCSRRC